MNPRASICALAAAILALATLGAGVRWGAMVAGGADSYGYVSQAGYWQRGAVVVQEDVIRPSPWPGAALTWSPLGYRPSPRRPDAIVPLYAPDCRCSWRWARRSPASVAPSSLFPCAAR